MAMGWKPKDQWDGDPNEHRSAREFIDRGELLGKIKSANGEMKELKDMVRFLTDSQRKQYEVGYQTAIKDLKSAKVEALERGDHEAVVEIDEQIADTKEKMKAVKAQPQSNKPTIPEPSEITKSWLAANKWYNEEAAMRAVANQLAVDYSRLNGANPDEAELYRYIDTHIRKAYPAQFEKKQQRVAPNPDGASRAQAGGAQGKSTDTPKQQFRDLLKTLSKEDARAAENLVERGYVNEEQFLKDFAQVSGGR
jgi:hypothetical protein